MKSVRQLLNQKGRRVWSIDPDATVFDVIEMMAKKDIGALVVLDETRLIGLISERHYARNVVLNGRTSVATLVRDVMEKRVVTTKPHDSIEECMTLMTECRVRHLPVLAEGRVIGIISIGDLVQSIIVDQQFAIRQLENYIQGSAAM